MRVITLFLKAYLKNDFSASLPITSGNKLFVTIIQLLIENIGLTMFFFLKNNTKVFEGF